MQRRNPNMYEGMQVNTGRSQSRHHCYKHLGFRFSTLQMLQPDKGGTDKKVQVRERSRPYGKLCTGAVQKCFCHPPSVLTSQNKNNGGEESCVLYCNFSAVFLSHMHTHHFRIIVSNHER